MKLNLPQVMRDAANEWLEQYDGYYNAVWEDLRYYPAEALSDAPDWAELLGIYGFDLYGELWDVLNHIFLDVCLSIVSTRMLPRGDEDA